LKEAAMSALLDRSKLAGLAGLIFGGKRDLDKVFGYENPIPCSSLLHKYYRQDIVGRIVDMPAESTWELHPKVTFDASDFSVGADDGDADSNSKLGLELEAVFKKLEQQLSIWDRLIQADKLCNFGPFAILWFGMAGKAEAPAPKVRSLEDIVYIQAHGGDSVSIKAYDEDPQSVRYGQPTMYEVVPQNGNEARRTPIRIHHSRVVHIVDKPLQGQVYSRPRLELISNTLQDLLKISGGSSELFWLTANRGMQVDIARDMQLSPEDEKDLTDELEEYQHQLRRYIRTRGVAITELGSSVADPTGVFRVLIALISSATNIPQRLLIGAEAGQLASAQDRANWADYIERRRTIFAEPYVLLPLLRRLIALGLLPTEALNGVRFTWPEAFKMSPLEEAQALAAQSRAVNSLASRGRFGSPIISDEEARSFLQLPRKVPAGDTMPEAPNSSNPISTEDLNTDTTDEMLKDDVPEFAE